MDAVVTSGLRKSYGAHEVLHGIDLRVPAGSLYGFLGPNGAGKTTTIRILLGLLRSCGGNASVLGRDCWHDGPAVRAKIGYLCGDVRYYPQLTGAETLTFLDRARGLDSSAEIRRLADVFDLELAKRVRNYSRGMKQKLGLIAALMHRPELAILDEPTVALDPLMAEALHAELRQASTDGRTVLFSSHTLSEVEQLCNWVGIVRDGHLIEQDRIESLRQRAVRHVEILFDHSPAADASLPAGLGVSHRGQASITASWTGPTRELLAWLSQKGVRDVTITPPSLEDLFMAYYNAPDKADR